MPQKKMIHWIKNINVDDSCDVSALGNGDIIRYMTNATGLIVRIEHVYYNLLNRGSPAQF